jgi:hypothetical protein
MLRNRRVKQFSGRKPVRFAAFLGMNESETRTSYLHLTQCCWDDTAIEEMAMTLGRGLVSKLGLH